MFVLCSENHAASALVAACAPSIVLQTFGGAGDPSDASARSTFEYAITTNAVRRVIVCGHLACKAAPLDRGADARTLTQAELIAQCRSLREDARIGALLREHGVTLHAIWFDDREGDVYGCDIDGNSATLLNEVDIGRVAW